MDISTKYEFTALDSNDLLDKIKTRLEGLGLVTQLYSDNIIGGVTLGKRLHVKVGNYYINFGSSLNRHPASSTGTSNTNWVAANAQSVACSVSRTFNSGLSWFGNESSTFSTLNCIFTENNCLTRIFTTATSIAIVCNYSSIYYNTLYINWADELFVTATFTTTNVPKNAAQNLFEFDSLYGPECIYNSGFYRSLGTADGLFGGEIRSKFTVPSYQPIYNRLYNLVNKASAIIPNNIYFRVGSNNLFLRSLEDIGIVNMKNVTAAFIFDTSGKKYQAFPMYTIDISSNVSMGYIFRIE